jgi:3-phosphoshikimate 1-carboxyvinyltransferase
MMKVFPPKGNINTLIELPGSKSISNRLLMIRAISGLPIHFKNLSDSEDTILLAKALGQIHGKTSGTVNINHAGTDMRFLTAHLAIKEGDWIITGSERMKQRPIAELVNALRELGADITYTEKEGFPPLKINGKRLHGGRIEIDGSISSQYISALMLIAPVLSEDLEIVLKGNVVSLPYIKMTGELLKLFGVYVSFDGKRIVVSPAPFGMLNDQIWVESDWSAASYWFNMVALSKNAEIELKYLDKFSLQADSILPEMYSKLGVRTEFIEKGIRLTNLKNTVEEFEYDFTNCPDIAQTIAVSCFGLGVKAHLTGLQTLKIKETDRISAIKTELEKLGAVVEVTNNSLKIEPPKVFSSPNSYVSTYNDHRMAMSFSPLAIKFPGLKIENPNVVDKSYPAFWDDLQQAGFDLR